MFVALKFTINGIGSIGQNNSNTIGVKYRGLHTSYIGRLDLNSSSSSEPGQVC